MYSYSKLIVSMACLAAVLPAAQPVRRPGAAFKPALEISTKPIDHGKAPASLSDVDFKNFSYHFGFRDDEGRPVRNGRYSQHEGLGFDDVRIANVWLFGAEAGQAGYALVNLSDTYGGGSSTSEDVLLLFTVRNGRLVLIQQLTARADAPGAGVVFTPATRSLTVRGKSDDGSPECCPRQLDVIRLTWTGGGFAVAGAHRVPVPPGK